MPSPFPGIDPYLEAQGYWPDFHASLILYCRDVLNEVLPDTYEARVSEQLRLVERGQERATLALPDVSVIEAGPRGGRGRSQGAVGVLTLEPVVLDLPQIELEEVRDVWIEILRRPDRDLVTAIEILSPSNKEGSGHRDYLGKRHELTHRSVHLVELDLLIRGRRLPMEQPLPPGDFYAIVSRFERRPKAEVFAWTIRQRPPVLPIPLLAPDPDVLLDLPGLLANAHERGRYARSLNYATPLDLPLPADERAWAEAQTRAGVPGA